MDGGLPTPAQLLEEQERARAIAAAATVLRGAATALETAIRGTRPPDELRRRFDEYVRARESWRALLLGQAADAVEVLRAAVRSPWMREDRRCAARTVLAQLDHLVG